MSLDPSLTVDESLLEELGADKIRTMTRRVSYGALYDADDDEEEDEIMLSSTIPTTLLDKWTVICILSTAFSYGCIFSTLFLITLPIECERIHKVHPSVPKSISLGIFVAIAGITQLVSPLVGRLSDIYVPPAPPLQLGQRLPYLVLGSVLTVTGLLGQMFASYGGFWLRYSLFFFLHMIGLNIQYAMMLALLPDQVPKVQTGMANGILALELVTGSLFAFGLFYSILFGQIQSMYGLYTSIVILSTIATGTHAHDRDAELAFQRTRRRRRQKQRSLTLLQQGQSSSTISMDNNGKGGSSSSSKNNSHQNVSTSSLASNTGTSITPRWRRAAKKAAKKAQQVFFLTPTVVLKSLLVDPFKDMDWAAFWRSYVIDTDLHYNFFVVTVSRLFYYSGMSIQTFFLYYVHDILRVDAQDAESVVAKFAILGQFSAAFTSYPIGVFSDMYLNGQRRPLVFLACTILLGASLSLIWISSLHQMLTVVVVLGAANGMYLTMETSLAVDTLPEDLEDSAQLLGVWGVAAFLGSALGPMIGGPLLFIFGRQSLQEGGIDAGDDVVSSDTESYDLQGYVVLFSLGAIYFFISAIVLLFIRK